MATPWLEARGGGSTGTLQQHPGVGRWPPVATAQGGVQSGRRGGAAGGQWGQPPPASARCPTVCPQDTCPTRRPTQSTSWVEQAFLPGGTCPPCLAATALPARSQAAEAELGLPQKAGRRVQEGTAWAAPCCWGLVVCVRHLTSKYWRRWAERVAARAPGTAPGCHQRVALSATHLPRTCAPVEFC